MTFDELVSILPNFVFVVGDEWFRANSWCNEDYVSSRVDSFQQLDTDLSVIQRQVDLQKLKKNYQALLRDKNSFWTTLHEIHGISLISEISATLTLKVPTGDASQRDFDAQACVNGILVNIECKTRTDNFPFNLPPKRLELGTHPVYSGSRATFDPHDLEQSSSGNSDPLHIPIPEATEVRRILSDALSQLPSNGVNLVILGQINGDKGSLETALYGPVAVTFWQDHSTRELKSDEIRLPHGAYDPGPNGEAFRQLSAVLWFNLSSAFGPEYRLYPNPNSPRPLPDQVFITLKNITELRTTRQALQ